MKTTDLRKEESPRFIRKSSVTLVILFTFFLLFPSPVFSWTGKVIGVTDGDTITVLEPNQKTQV